MKHKNNSQAIILPDGACEKAGFTERDTLEICADNGVFVLYKENMTALELANTIDSLSTLASELIVALAAACGTCDNCGENEYDNMICGRCKGRPVQWVSECDLCNSLLNERQDVHIPEYILEEAGILPCSKLKAYVDEAGEIVVKESEIQQSICDIPEGVLSVLKASGVCLAELDDLIVSNSIIYGI